MKKFVVALLVAAAGTAAIAARGQTAKPVVVDGQAQIVPEFADQTQWIRHRLWIETEFDSARRQEAGACMWMSSGRGRPTPRA